VGLAMSESMFLIDGGSYLIKNLTQVVNQMIAVERLVDYSNIAPEETAQWKRFGKIGEQSL